MKIYIAHTRKIDYENDLYEPIKRSPLNNKHLFILPHEKSQKAFESKKFLQNDADIIIAEVSEGSIGLGVELGWADIYKVPIICIFKKGSYVSGSLRVITKDFIEYTDGEDLIKKLEKKLEVF